MRAYLSLGSNMGDRGYYLREALRLLAEIKELKITAKSHVYETKPWGLTDQADFWNLAVEIETGLEPLELLKTCQDVENSLERKRIMRWGPRTIDIDILLYDNRVSNLEEITLPHPRMEEREFVLAPLREIAPELVLPSGRSIREVSGEGEVKRLDLGQQSGYADNIPLCRNPASHG